MKASNQEKSRNISSCSGDYLLPASDWLLVCLPLTLKIEALVCHEHYLACLQRTKKSITTAGISRQYQYLHCTEHEVRLLPSKSFPIHYPFVVLKSVAIEATVSILKASLRKESGEAILVLGR